MSRSTSIATCSHILATIDGSTLSDRQRELATRIFRKIAEAEAKVHGTTIEKVHFHEVGAVDSIADIVGTAIGWDLLGVERAVCSPVPTGRGFVEIAHGRCAIPCPGTAELLRGVPLAELPVEGELTTPTGAAIVATLADAFGPLPAMTIERIGYGAGQRDYGHANVLRLIVGEAASTSASSVEPRPEARQNSSHAPNRSCVWKRISTTPAVSCSAIARTCCARRVRSTCRWCRSR